METKTAAPPAYSQPGGGFVPPPAMGPIIKAPKFDREPLRMECPHCRNHILTRTRGETSLAQWISGIALFALSAGILSCIPCCIDSLKDVKHYCPQCNTLLGTYKRFNFSSKQKYIFHISVA